MPKERVWREDLGTGFKKTKNPLSLKEEKTIGVSWFFVFIFVFWLFSMSWLDGCRWVSLDRLASPQPSPIPPTRENDDAKKIQGEYNLDNIVISTRFCAIFFLNQHWCGRHFSKILMPALVSHKSCDIFILCETNLSSAPSSHNLLSGHLGNICLWLKSYLKLKKEKLIVKTINYLHLELLVLKFQISDCGKPGWMSEWVTGVCTAGNFFFRFQ